MRAVLNGTSPTQSRNRFDGGYALCRPDVRDPSFLPNLTALIGRSHHWIAVFSLEGRRKGRHV